MDIGPGDLVECVVDDHGPAVRHPIFRGYIYVVRRMVESVEACGLCGLIGISLVVEGDEPVTPTAGWCPCVFRPLRRPPSADLINTLKRPVDEPVKETA